jgi:phosphate transport system permease protein
MTTQTYPEGDSLQQQINRRHRVGKFGRTAFLVATLTGIVALTALLFNIINTAFGMVAVVNKVDPNSIVMALKTGADLDADSLNRLTIDPTVVGDTQLEDVPYEALINVLAANVTTGVGRRLEREKRFYTDGFVFETTPVFTEACASDNAPASCNGDTWSQSELTQLIMENVVEPNVVQAWSLMNSIFNRQEITTLAASDYPEATLEFRSWLTPRFLTNPQSSTPELAGVRTATLGTLWVIAITIFFSFPIGVGAAIYLEEYAGNSPLNKFIQTNINNLAGVPSIIYGILGLAIFVRALELLTSGQFLATTDSTTTANGRTILSAGLTLGLLILPIIIISSQEAIRAVPNSLRQASMGLGATKWQTIWHHVLPNAFSGILTGTILSMSRAIGETAPLVVVGASTFVTFDPSSPFSKFTTLPIQIFQWTSRPQAEFRNIAAAAILVLLVLLITLNATAIIMRNRYAKKFA